MSNSENVQQGLLKLGKLLEADTSASYEGGESYRDSFDEYMRHNELELALEVACDYLSSEGSQLIDSSVMSLIEELHSLMGIQDDCIPRLEGARRQAQQTR